METSVKVLLVDEKLDELEPMVKHLSDTGFEVLCAQGDQAALSMLDNQTDIELVLLDQPAPGIDGLRVLTEIKSKPELSHIPVIMHTSHGTDDDIRAAMRAGAYYYLKKPFDPKVFSSIINAALEDPNRQRTEMSSAEFLFPLTGLLQSTEFRFQTIEEATTIASYVAQMCKDPEKLQIGLSELMINAVEHGNLNITYEEKSELVAAGEWKNEVNRRLKDPAYRDRFATLNCKREKDYMVFVISDQGNGFDWPPYLDISEERAFDPHGRGIALASLISFEKIEYLKGGNEVHCWFLDSPPQVNAAN